MKQILLLNPENVTDVDAENLRQRAAARAVVFDGGNKVALLHVTKQNYYKLPGGGMEENEDKETALRRECLEEIGCDVEVIGEVGSVEEYRKIFNLRQISYCYLAKIKGDKGSPNFTKVEIAGGFEQIWVPMDEAIRLLKESEAKTPEGRDYIVPRDLALLRAARDVMNSAR